MNARGNFPYTTYPRIPGRDFVGTVVDGPPSHPLLGKSVFGTSGFEHGFSQDGFHAEYALVHENSVMSTPKNITTEQASTLGVPFTTAMLALRRADVTKGETVLVLGATGAVGTAAVQLLQAKGCRVITASRGETTDVNTLKDPDLNSLESLTYGIGIDVVIDTVGYPALLSAAVRKLTFGGRAAFITAPKGGASRDFTLDMREFYREEKSLVGVNSLKYSAEAMARDLREVSQLLGQTKLKISNPWTKVKLENSVAAYEKASQKGKEKFLIIM
jgi:NADPH:quinone reductase-like Zn-dependent oxidoreductase